MPRAPVPGGKNTPKRPVPGGRNTPLSGVRQTIPGRDKESLVDAPSEDCLGCCQRALRIGAQHEGEGLWCCSAIKPLQGLHGGSGEVRRGSSCLAAAASCRAAGQLPGSCR